MAPERYLSCWKTFLASGKLLVKEFEAFLLRLLPPTNEVCEGYVFTGVCLSTGGGLHSWGGGVCIQGMVCIQGWSASGGVCIHASRRGLHPGGVGQTPPQLDTTGYGQRAGGTHPTGMHSWLKYL